VLVVQNTWALGKAASTFRDEVKQMAGVEQASLSDALPTDPNTNSTSYFKDPSVDQKRSILTFDWSVDENFIPALGIKMIAGRNFSKDMKTDTAAVIINEAFAKQLGYPSAVDQSLYQPADAKFTKMNRLRIIGVMKDFNFKSLRDNVTPMLFAYNQGSSQLSVRINTANIPALLDNLKTKWKELSPNRQFSYAFLDQNFDALYRAEQRTGAISIAFTTLAIIIACLGLFGLAAYAAEQRTKEIGIRKVLGANISTIVGMLSKDFIRLVLIAIVIAVPLGWWAMHGWLESFAYRQEIQWWVPAVAAVAAIAIAFITISFQSVKAALTNPVKSLRSE
jgi:putative ABC transport system permease protein